MILFVVAFTLSVSPRVPLDTPAFVAFRVILLITVLAFRQCIMLEDRLTKFPSQSGRVGRLLREFRYGLDSLRA